MATPLTLRPEAVEICRSATKNYYSLRDLSKRLFVMLVHQGAIKEEDDFVAVKSNSALMLAISMSIGKGLTQDVSQSTYGLGIVSDFDLYFNMKTDAKFNDILAKTNFDRNREEYEKLRTNRGNIYRFVYRIRNAIIMEFDLLGTPDTRTEKKAKKQKVVTPENVDAMIIDQLESAKNNKSSKSAVSNDIDEEAEETSVVGGRLKKKITVINDGDEEMDFEEDYRTNVPIAKEFQQPLYESTVSLTEASLRNIHSEDFVRGVSDAVLTLKTFVSDFKAGETLMLRYDMEDQQFHISISQGNKWLKWDQTIAMNLLNPVASTKTDDNRSISEISDDTLGGITKQVRKIGWADFSLELPDLDDLRKELEADMKKAGKYACDSWTKTGKCKFGDNCFFSHN